MTILIIRVVWSVFMGSILLYMVAVLVMRRSIEHERVGKADPLAGWKIDVRREIDADYEYSSGAMRWRAYATNGDDYLRGDPHLSRNRAEKKMRRKIKRLIENRRVREAIARENDSRRSADRVALENWKATLGEKS